jgi:hypothetical protein
VGESEGGMGGTERFVEDTIAVKNNWDSTLL